MTPTEFRDWRKRLGLSQARAAEALGLGRSTVEQYDSGKRRDRDEPVKIPRTVALACAAIEAGLG